jgi:hypothetical protein
MKKNSPLRLKLHRETLGSLTSGQMEIVQGGVGSFVRTCTCPTYTCPTVNGGTCSGTTTTC